jgi:glycine dehydrogenase subunit 1
LGREYAEFQDGLLVAITERRTPEQIDALAEALEAAVAAERGGLLSDSESKSPQGAVA